MGQYFNLNGTAQKSRSSNPKRTPTLYDDDISDPEKLGKVLTDMLARIAALEASKPADFIEFEMSCPASGSVRMAHNFGCPVRFYLTSWKGAASHNLRMDETNSDLNTLVLTSGAAGRATVRVEKSQFNLIQGST